MITQEHPDEAAWKKAITDMVNCASDEGHEPSKTSDCRICYQLSVLCEMAGVPIK